MNTPAIAVIQSVPPRSPPVVLLKRRGDRPAAREWAETLSSALDAELVQLEFTGLPEGAGSPGGAWGGRTSALARRLRRFGPRVVVMAAGCGWPAESAGWLASAARAPCLVARASRGRRPVLAATSLEDPCHPVVLEACSLATALDRPLTIVHNDLAQIAGADRGVHLEAERRLARLADELGADAVLTRSVDVASGILTEARREDADLIVVGASGSPPDSGPAGAVITQMARRSVLVVPPSA
ncbi:MAG: universal stress protein [Myxococcaceae bacterium]|nr:universal stress protein [Myxococcaceae bacterium]